MRAHLNPWNRIYKGLPLRAACKIFSAPPLFQNPGSAPVDANMLLSSLETRIRIISLEVLRDEHAHGKMFQMLLYQHHYNPAINFKSFTF